METIHITASSTYSSFQITQTPSGGQIPAGTEISIKLQSIPSISNEIDYVLLFYCLIGDNSSCGSYPQDMTENVTSQIFCSSVTPNCPNTQLRYRFIVYYTNGTPVCFPNCDESEFNMNIIQGEAGLYYFTIEITEYQKSIGSAGFTFIAPFFSLVTLVFVKVKKKIRDS
jgi:hypothetical protein